jgi:hypothetical protein
MSLPLKPGTGYLYSKPRPTPAKHKELIDEHITELLQQGIIRPSKSTHATNIVIVKKKSGVGEPPKTRMCVDLREVNEHSIPSRFPNHSLEDSLEKIQGARFRSSFDFNQAFHQIVLSEESIPVTAFYANNILYEYVRLPFGHVTAMQGFCSLMALLCHDYPPASYYADDLMITTPNDPTKTREELFQQHLEDIKGMLIRIAKAGLKLSAHKCQWAYDSARPMDWLGFTLENNLLKPQESKVKSVKEFPTPKSAKQAISFVSLASFYRRFIKSFARIAQPIYEVSKAEVFIWTSEAEKAFNDLKEAMCSDLILRLPRQGEPFTVYTDASWSACGAVLAQKDPVDQKLHPCAFGSRKFNDAELKMSTPCKELLAIAYALNLWAFYLCGNQVHVLSDCKAWSFLKVQSGTSSKISRLALLVQEYDVTIGYIPGEKNKAADGLSRAFDDGTIKCDNIVANRHPALEYLTAPPLQEGEVLKLGKYLDICEEYLKLEIPRILKIQKDKEKDNNGSTISINHLNEIGEDIEGVLEDLPLLHKDRIEYFRWLRKGRSMKRPIDKSETTYCSKNQKENASISLVTLTENCFSFEGFQKLQKEDSFCSQKLKDLKAKSESTLEAGYFIRRQVLMRRVLTKDGQKFDVVVVPSAIIKPLLESSHNSLGKGHFGSEKYLLDMRRKYFWPSMKKDIINFHKQCIPCQFNDKYPVKFHSGNIIKPLYPMSVVYLDLVTGLPRSTTGCHAMLMVYDGFSRFAQAIPLASEKADYIVRKFMAGFISSYGPPFAIHSDNARNLDGSIMRHLCLMLGSTKTSTPTYNPNSNPCETICGAIVMLIRKALTGSDQRYWDLCLPFVLSAYNSTIHTMTGYTPNSLFLGRYKERDLVPLVPFDSESANVDEYFQKMRRFQELAFDIVQKRNAENIKSKKIQMDKNAIRQKFQIGDYVLVKNLAPGLGPGLVKLRSKYIGPFRIIKVYPSSLVLVPWSLTSKLDEFYRDPNLFRLMHRGDVKSFETRLVPMKNVKPYRGPVDKQNIIEPLLLDKFVEALELSSIPDLSSQVDADSDLNSNASLFSRNSSASSGSSATTDSGGPGSPGGGHAPVGPGSSIASDPQLPQPPAAPLDGAGDGADGQQPLNLNQQDILQPAGDFGYDAFLDGGLDNLDYDVGLGLGQDSLSSLSSSQGSSVEMSSNEDLQLSTESSSPNTEEDLKEAGKERARSLISSAKSLRLKIDELEQLMLSPDPDIRIRAEEELMIANDQLRLARLKAGIPSQTSSSEKSVEFQPEPQKTSSPMKKGDVELGADETGQTDQFGSAISEQDVPDLEDMPDLENVEEEKEPVAGPSALTKVNLQTPSFKLTITPMNPFSQYRPSPSKKSPPLTVTSPTAVPGATSRTREWVEQLPVPERKEPVPAPRFTRAGREIRPPVKFDPADEVTRQKRVKMTVDEKPSEEKSRASKKSVSTGEAQTAHQKEKETEK